MQQSKKNKRNTACVTQGIIDSMQKANLNLLFNLLSDIGIRNVQKEKEILIGTMCNQSVGIDFAGYRLYKQQKVA